MGKSRGGRVLWLTAATFLFIPSLGAVALSQSAASATPLLNTGEAWGADGTGQLGNSSTVDSDTAVTNGLTGITEVSAGNGFALALMNNGTVMAWGDNTYGELGTDPTSSPSSCVPIAVTAPGLTDVKEVSAGDGFALALLKTGVVMAWGDNSDGQLGQDPTSVPYSYVPTAVSGVGNATSVKAGGSFALAVVQYGTVMAWGDNSYGELGVDPTSTPWSSRPVEVSSNLVNDVSEVAAGSDFALALMGSPSPGTVMAWGDNSDGQLGIDPSLTAYSDTPTQVSGLSSVRGVQAGGAHGLALLPQGEVAAWGDNSNGQLGDGGTSDSYTPMTVPDLTGVASVKGGEAFTLALMENGTVMAWGANSNGELGDGSTVDSDAPIEVSNLRGVQQIAPGSDFGIAKAKQVSPFMTPLARKGAREGVSFDKTLKVRSLPTYSTITESGALPAGVTFTDNGNNTATVAGVPAEGSTGTYVLRIAAANGVGSPANELFTLVVRAP